MIQWPQINTLLKVIWLPKSTGKELIKSTTYGTPEFRVFPTSVNRGLWRGALEHVVRLTYTSLHLMGARTKDRGKLISLAATAFPTFYPWIQVVIFLSIPDTARSTESFPPGLLTSRDCWQTSVNPGTARHLPLSLFLTISLIFPSKSHQFSQQGGVSPARPGLLSRSRGDLTGDRNAKIHTGSPTQR